MALRGDLSEFAVEHVLRLLELSGQTGTLDVRGPGGKASIEVTAGAVTGVRGTDEPEIALGRALLDREGTFAFKPGTTDERVIDAPLDELIERSRAKAAEAIEIEAVIPNESVRFRLSDRAMSGGAFTVGPNELKVLMEVGGGRSVREIRQRSRTPRSRTAALLYALLQKGLVERTESEAAVAVQTVGAAPRRSRRAPTKAEPASAEPPSAQAEPPPGTEAVAIEVAPAPSSGEAVAADLSARELADELDARLAAIGVAAPAEGPATEAQPDGELIVVTPSVGPAPTAGAESAPEATVVFALHYMPPTAQPVEPAPPPAPPKRRGLFDFVLRRPSAATAQSEIDIPAPADLASVANTLYAEYKRQAEAMDQLGSHAERSARAFEETLSARLARVYGMRAVGSRVPLRGDAVDVGAIRSGDIAPARILPYLALLVRDLRDEAIRVFGADDARATYEAVAGRIFGRQVASPTMILQRVAVPQRARLTVRAGDAGPFELREGTYTIGRAKDCEVVLNDLSVSGHHARVVSGIAGYTLSDLGSRNGTTLNGVRLSGPHALRTGDVIGLGDMVVVYEQLTP